MIKSNVVIIGFGIQGKKRNLVAGDNIVAIIDPISTDANLKNIKELPLNKFDTALICTGDSEKIEIIEYLLKNKKHVLVEKPLLSNSTKDLEKILNLSSQNKVACYTAYNHRFEPHFIEMEKLIKSNELGKIYNIRMFYGNGTANLVKKSSWRDRKSGVLSDLGSHLFDTLHFWIDNIEFHQFKVTKALKKENLSFDYVVVHNQNEANEMSIQLEMSLLSWKNTFTCDVFGEKGSAHINSLCKWGPTEFIHRKRILPSGVPIERKITLLQDDPTWKVEYDLFLNSYKHNKINTLRKDIWINKILLDLSKQANVENII